MRVTLKSTGQTGTIPDNEFDPNVYAPISSQPSAMPSPTATQSLAPQSTPQTQQSPINNGNIPPPAASPSLLEKVYNAGAAILKPATDPLKDVYGMVTNGVGSVGDYLKYTRGNAQDKQEAGQSYAQHAKDLAAIQQKYGFSAPNSNPDQSRFGQVGDINVPKFLTKETKGAAGVSSLIGGGIAPSLGAAVEAGGAAGALRGYSEGDTIDPNKIAAEGVGGAIGGGLAYGAQKVGGAAINHFKGGGDKLIASEYTLSPGQSKAFNLEDNIGKAKDLYGVTNPDDVAQLHEAFSGKSGIFNQINEQAIGDSGPVSTSGLLDVAKEAAKNPNIDPSKSGQLLEYVNNSIKDIGGDKADPTKALGFVRELEKYANGIKPDQTGALAPNDAAMKEFYNTVADNVKNRLFAQPIDPDILQKLASNTMTPQDAQALLSTPQFQNAYETITSGKTGDIVKRGLDKSIQNGDYRGAFTALETYLPQDMKLQLHPAILAADATGGAPAAAALEGATKPVLSQTPLIPGVNLPSSDADLIAKATGSALPAGNVSVNRYLTPDVIKQIADINPQIAKTITDKMANGGVTVNDLRAFQAPLVNLDKAVTASGANEFASASGKGVTKGLGKITNAVDLSHPLKVLNPVLSSKPVNDFVGRNLEGLGNGLESAGNAINTAIPPAAQQMAGSTAGAMIGGNAVSNRQAAPSTNDASQVQGAQIAMTPGQPPSPQASQMGGTAQPPSNVQSQSLPQPTATNSDTSPQYVTGHSPQQLYAAHEKAMAAGDIYSANQLEKMYTDELNYQQQQRQIALQQKQLELKINKPYTAKQQQLQKVAVSGLGSVQDMQSILTNNNTTGVNSPGYTYTLPDIAGGNDRYKFALSNIKSSLKLMNPSMSDAALNEMLPSATNSPTVVQSKLQKIKDLLNSFAYQQTGAGIDATDQTDMTMQ